MTATSSPSSMRLCAKVSIRRICGRTIRTAHWPSSATNGKPVLSGDWPGKRTEKRKVRERRSRTSVLREPAGSIRSAPEEQAAGWVLLFDGESGKGWHSFGRDDVRPGWQIKDGVLTCADPRDAGDLCTDSQYDWFELRLEYNISEGGNSGIMFRVTDEGDSPWATGPEFQLEDNAKASDPIRCGWLYGLYQPPNDPKTGQAAGRHQAGGRVESGPAAQFRPKSACTRSTASSTSNTCWEVKTSQSASPRANSAACRALPRRIKATSHYKATTARSRSAISRFVQSWPRSQRSQSPSSSVNSSRVSGDS